MSDPKPSVHESSTQQFAEAPNDSGRPITEVPPTDLPQQIEAALMTTDRPLPAAKLSELLGKTGTKAINKTIEQLNGEYEQTGRTFRIEQVAGGWQILTLPKYADILATLHKSRQQSRLSPAALETLAIIAYKQPILRADIESIRGVACGEVLRSLLERHLIKIVGRAEELGRPMLYGTTKIFLEVFGLSGLGDLPKTEAEGEAERSAKSEERGA